MFVYDVYLRIDADVETKYLSWLMPHIKKMLGYQGFLKAELFTEVPEDEKDTRKGYIVRYYLKNKASYQNYVKNHAEKMRAEAFEQFDGKFEATRKTYTMMDQFLIADIENTMNKMLNKLASGE